MSHEVNLKKYAERIGFRGDFRPDYETLAVIQKGHSTHIPFENLDVMQDLPINIDLPSLEDKLVNRRRGGYCFEQNGLLLGVLQQIGFEVTPLSARVRLGAERDYTPARTHLFLRIDLDGETWLVDAGVGGLSLTAPIRFVEDVEQSTPHESRRIVRESGVYYHQAWMGQEWMDVYEFTGESMPLIDRQVSNWWTSTHPTSRFKQGVFSAMARSNGERFGILQNVFTHRKGAEVIRTIEFRSLDGLLDVLRSEFGIILPGRPDFGELEWMTP